MHFKGSRRKAQEGWQDMAGRRAHRAKPQLRDCQLRSGLKGDTGLADTGPNNTPRFSEDFGNLGGE